MTLLLLLTASALLFSAASYHVGIVTGTVSQAEDSLRGAEALIAEYGSASEGGIIRHATYPDNFMDEQETTISIITGLADDPLMRAIIVNQGIPGTAEAFRQIKERRPEIILISGQANEEPYLISAIADLAIVDDFLARGYLMVKTAHDLGLKTFLHVSFPRHLAMERMQRRRAIMQEAAKEFGIKFVDISSPDPTSDVGVAGAQQYILENTPIWVEQYGKDTAFFTTNDAQKEPMLRQLIKYGGYYIEGDSPIIGFPGALGLDLSAQAGDFPAILDKVEEAIIEQGGGGRFATWAYSVDYTMSAGLGQLAIDAIEAADSGKRFEVNSIRNIKKAFAKYTPGAEWNGSYYVDAVTGVNYRNYVLVYEDTYLLGQGYLDNISVEVPEKYFYISGK